MRYAAHAGISRQAAAEQLRRVGIDYLSPFDFSTADTRREAARHADRAAVKDPAFATLQLRREYYRAELDRLAYEERIQQLVSVEEVNTEAGRCARQIRDAFLNVPSRLAGILAAESDQRKVHDLLEQELRGTLEALSGDETGRT